MHRLVTLLIVSATVVACGGGESRKPAASPAGRAELGVVGIEARIGRDLVRSSGIVSDANASLVVTTAHTVWGARSLKLATPVGILHGRIVARAPCDDLAVIEAYPRIPGLVSPAAAPSPASSGQLVRTLGRRGTDPDAGAYGYVSIPARAAGRAAAAPPLPGGTTALDTPLVPEVSGGAVLDQAGRLVGMAIPQEARPGLSLPWRTIRGRLDELRPGPREVYVGWRDRYRCVSALHAYERAHHPGFHARDARLDAYVPATRLPGTEELDG